MPENTPENKPKRKVPHSAWKPGQSGNPGGRPPTDHAFKELCRQKTPKALAALEKALGEPRERVAAAQVILAYAHGKPIQRNEHTGADGGPIQTQTVEDTRPPLDDLVANALAAIEQETRH